MGLYTELAGKKLRPFSELPIWARMKFTEMIPEVYFWGSNPENPRKISEVTVEGFKFDSEGAIWIYYHMDWIVGDKFQTLDYLWPVTK
jgi:hypothetical protein